MRRRPWIPSYSDEAKAEALKIECPYCKMPAGEQCRASDRGRPAHRPTLVHQARLRATQEKPEPEYLGEQLDLL